MEQQPYIRAGGYNPSTYLAPSPSAFDKRVCWVGGWLARSEYLGGAPVVVVVVLCRIILVVGVTSTRGNAVTAIRNNTSPSNTTVELLHHAVARLHHPKIR